MSIRCLLSAQNRDLQSEHLIAIREPIKSNQSAKSPPLGCDTPADPSSPNTSHQHRAFHTVARGPVNSPSSRIRKHWAPRRPLPDPHRSLSGWQDFCLRSGIIAKTLMLDSVAQTKLPDRIKAALCHLAHNQLGSRNSHLHVMVVFDIVTPSANLVSQKSKLPHYPERLLLRMLEKPIA